MEKLVICLAAVLLVSCDNVSPPNLNEVISEKQGIDKENACAEIFATRIFETSKRMEIFKSYGYTPVQGQLIEGGLEMNQQMSGGIDKLRSYENSWSQGRVDRMEACLAEHGMTCIELLTKVEEGSTEEEIVASNFVVLACMKG